MKESELKSEKYKNKLINRPIMRVCKKEYYNKLFENIETSVKAIWNTVNGIIRKRQIKSNYPEHFTDSDMTLTNMNDVVNRINNYFFDVGPKLAKNRKNTGKECTE